MCSIITNKNRINTVKPNMLDVFIELYYNPTTIRVLLGL